VLQNGGNVLIIWETVSFSRRNLFHGVRSVVKLGNDEYLRRSRKSHTVY